MSVVIDANMKLFTEVMGVTSSQLIDEYGLSSIDEIIEKEAAKGNTKAVDYVREYSHSPIKLIQLFKLMDVENRFSIISNMDSHTRLQLLPLLDHDDLAMGLYYFQQGFLLKELMKVNIIELVRVALSAFPIEQIMLMLKEEDLAMFFMNKNLPRGGVMEQLMLLPQDTLQIFLESVTGQPAEEVNQAEVFNNISSLSDDKFQKFMAGINPEVQRQLVFQLTQEDPEYLGLFPNETYINMLATLQKPDMVKSLFFLNTETIMNIDMTLPPVLLSVIESQINASDFAVFLQNGHLQDLERAMMI